MMNTRQEGELPRPISNAESFDDVTDGHLDGAAEAPEYLETRKTMCSQCSHLFKDDESLREHYQSIHMRGK